MREEDAFGHWLAGFVDGEGCFDISYDKKWGCYHCRFVVEVRSDDATILHEAAAAIGVGTVRIYDRGVKGRNVKWRVSSKAECLTLVAFFDRYPLRAKKARDYATWREAVLQWQEIRPALKGDRNDWTLMAQLKKNLSEGRRTAPLGV